tara:strand:- start:591 stop:1130 length:540 start_codon:yes stop_codon:yes gene_type:complete
MKLSRKQLRRLIEARIKPSLEVPGLDPIDQQKIDVLASSRDEDAMGREYADNFFDGVIDPLQGEDIPFSQREFEYDYPMVEDPNFAKAIADLFEGHMYVEKAFASDIEGGMTLEDYKEMARDYFMEDLPQKAMNSSSPSLRHTFSSGNMPYQLKDIVKRIVDPISERIWKDWSNWFSNN